MRFKFTVLLAAIPLLFLLSGYTADWSSLSGFTSITGANECSTLNAGKLTMDCQSAAWVSNQKFDYRQPITMSGSVLAQPGIGTANLAHFTLYGVDDAYGARYSGIYISYKDGVDKVFILGGGYSQQVATVPHKVHQARIEWDGSVYKHYLDGVLIKTWPYGALREPASIWVGCSSVNPGQPNDGSRAHCEFGAVTVTSSSPTPTATATATVTPRATVTAVANPVKGDIDCNGRIDGTDALLILRYTAGMSVSLPSGCPAIGQ